MSKDKLEEKARDLANHPYTIEVLKDKATSGEDIYLAKNPELVGCMAQGATIQEAIDNLVDARVEFIESLLEDGEPVPDAILFSLSTSGETESVSENIETITVELDPNFLTDLGKAVQPATRKQVMTIQPVLNV